MPETMPHVSDVAPVRRRSPRRKHFLIGSGVALAALTATLTVGFLATSGSVTFPATVARSGSTNLVYTGTTLASWGTTPFAGASSPKWESTSTARKNPTWTLGVLANGDVKSGGDIAMINANTTAPTVPMVVSVYLANAGQYSKDVTTYDLPIELACSTATVTTSSGKWTAWKTWKWSTGATLSSTTDQTFLTSNTPSLTWSITMAPDEFCEVSIGGVGTGLTAKIPGALYLSSTTTDGTSSYSPQFYVTAQRA